MNTVFLVTISILGLAMARRGGREGLGACSDGSMPTCPDGARPGHVRGQGRIMVACSDGSRPRTCPDGSMPARSSTGGVGGGRGGCAMAERLCCDGSSPTHDGDRDTKPCARGRPVCDIETM